MDRTSGKNGKSVVLVVLNSFIYDARVLKESRTLLGAGYRVSVCALHEDDLPVYENLDGIDIYRIKLKTRSWSKLRAVQLIKYAEFVVQALFKCRKSDIFHCNDLNTLPIGLLAKFFFRHKKVLYDSHEYGIHVSSDQSQKSIDRLFRLERFCIRYADGVTVTSEADAIEYAKMYGIEKPRVVMNCPPYQKAELSDDYFRKAFGIGASRSIFLFQGILWSQRNIIIMLEAFERLDGSDKCIVFMGQGEMVDTIREYAVRCDSIFLHEMVPMDELYAYTRAADCGITFLKNDCSNHNYALPNKLFEYGMARIPTLTSPLQEVSRVIKQYNMGVIVEGYTVDNLYDAVKSLSIADLESFVPSLESASRILCWEEQEKVLLEAYSSLYP